MADNLRNQLKKKSAAEKFGEFELGASPLARQPASAYSNPATPTPLKPEWMKQEEAAKKAQQEQMTEQLGEEGEPVEDSGPRVQFEKPEDINKFAKRLEEMAADLPEQSKAFYLDQARQLSEDNRQLEQAYKTEKERLQYWQVFEQLGNILVQLGAGIYGLKNGEDLSGVPFSQTDWESKYNRALKEHEIRKNDVLAQRRELASEQRGELRGVADRIKMTQNLLIEDRKNRRELYERSLLDAEKAAQSQQEKSAKLNQKASIMNSNFQQALNAIEKLKKGENEEENQAILRDSLAKTGSRKEAIDGLLKSAYDWFDDFTPLENYVKSQQKDWNDLIQSKGGSAPKSTGPQPGTVQGGYRFKGGDPANQANWEPVK